jgi:hypothetical protein
MTTCNSRSLTVCRQTFRRSSFGTESSARARRSPPLAVRHHGAMLNFALLLIPRHGLAL